MKERAEMEIGKWEGDTEEREGSQQCVLTEIPREGPAAAPQR